MAKTPTGLTAADLFERNRQWAASMIQEDPDAGWRERYGAEGTEETLPGA